MRKTLILLLMLVFLCGSASAATLNVGSTAKYKTVQSAVDATQSGDTVQVAYGTYHETVLVRAKTLNILGTKYPSIDGLKKDCEGSVNLNGFKIMKNGVDLQDMGGNTVRNNYIYTTGVVCGDIRCSGNTVMNNQFFNCGIGLYESLDNVVTGNQINKAPVGLGLYYGSTCTKITGNVFSGCSVGVQVPSVPACLTGNKYIGNKVNIKLV
jgi:nitrous oxidase accessory protein NosD